MKFLDSTRVRTMFNRRVQTKDSTELSIDLYLPPEKGRYPVLVHFTPYDNNRAGRFIGEKAQPVAAQSETLKHLAANGYIVASCDVRGTGDSEGVFEPFLNEGEDAKSVIDWLRTLDEGNGKLGIFGSGYSAFCGWAAIACNAKVDAIASFSPIGALGQSWLDRNGVIRLDTLFWAFLVSGRFPRPMHVPNWQEVFESKSYQEMEETLGLPNNWFSRWLTDKESRNKLAKSLDLSDGIRNNPVRGMHFTGWWDMNLPASKYYYDAAKESGALQRVLIGSWDTQSVRKPHRYTGKFDFGAESAADTTNSLLTFFKAEFLGIEGDTKDFQAFLYTTGSNKWELTKEWPQPSGSKQLFLTSVNAANTKRGDGTLNFDAPNNIDVIDEIQHEPNNPIPFQIGFKSFEQDANPQPLSFDQSHINSRFESLCYTTKPFESETQLVGASSLELTLESNFNANVIVLLSDVFPNEKADMNLSYGAVNLGNLAAFKTNEKTRIKIDLDEVKHTIFPGHSIRVTIVTSLFPLFCNLQNGLDNSPQSKEAQKVRLFLSEDTKLNLSLG